MVDRNDSYSLRRIKMFLKKNKTIDERIEKRSNELNARMLPLLWIIELGFLITKIVLNLPGRVYALEVCTIAAGLIVWLVLESRYGTLLIKEKDNILKELSIKAKAKAFMTMFWIVIIGELFYIFLIDKAYYLWVLSYLVGWVPCAAYITIVSVMEGLIVFGSKKKEVNTKKGLRLRTIIGSIFFGVVVGWDSYYHDGIFEPKGLISIPLLAVAWGIPFYLLFVGMMKYSEKHIDKKVEEMAEEDEK